MLKMDHLKRLAYPVIALLITVGCASTGTTVWHPKNSMGNSNAVNGQNGTAAAFDPSDFMELTFDSFPGLNIPAKLDGKKIKLKARYVSVAPGFMSGDFSPNLFITFMVGTPVNVYMANNPMHGPTGHIYTIIEQERAVEIFALPQNKNFYLYAEVVYLGDKKNGEYGLRALKIER